MSGGTLSIHRFSPSKTRLSIFYSNSIAGDIITTENGRSEWPMADSSCWKRGGVVWWFVDNQNVGREFDPHTGQFRNLIIWFKILKTEGKFFKILNNFIFFRIFRLTAKKPQKWIDAILLTKISEMKGFHHSFREVKPCLTAQKAPPRSFTVTTKTGK